MSPRSVLALTLVLAFSSSVWASSSTRISTASLAEAERMARAGSVVAQTYLGLLNDVGEGVREDPEAAAHWYRMAADQGNAEAQLFLGSAYLEGRGVHASLGNALFWLELASRGLQGEDRDTCERLQEQALWDASMEQLAAARERAEAWQPETAAHRPVAPRSAKSWARRVRYQTTLANLE